MPKCLKFGINISNGFPDNFYKKFFFPHYVQFPQTGSFSSCRLRFSVRTRGRMNSRVHATTNPTKDSMYVRCDSQSSDIKPMHQRGNGLRRKEVKTFKPKEAGVQEIVRIVCFLPLSLRKPGPSYKCCRSLNAIITAERGGEGNKKEGSKNRVNVRRPFLAA